MSVGNNHESSVAYKKKPDLDNFKKDREQTNFQNFNKK